MVRLLKAQADDIIEGVKITVQMLEEAHEHLDRKFVVSRIQDALQRLEKWRTQAAATNKVEHVVEAMKMNKFLLVLKGVYKEE